MSVSDLVVRSAPPSAPFSGGGEILLPKSGVRPEADRPNPLESLGPQGRAARSELVDKGIESARTRVTQAITRINQLLSQSATSVGFEVDLGSRQLIIRVTQKETGELIRQIPADSVIKFADAVDTLVGLLIDERA
ncbi:MAG: flagellar protein FlaG [Betaproteobacteria bacterium]|nr:flagellar protein FlaG [Betaproteobacteria bacterium]NBT75617.1 flagellar protein FlaG [Betaproteobacteria bacterium]NBY14438.1 flagellar protein FlaG [Betaproteobacteria bacterium]NCA16065.1 flagellar protein FlaG [Betaproteobacteria bacterium]NDF03494.1 flagellar protein FlaG [Betaproteobacteria bacterium]